MLSERYRLERKLGHGGMGIVYGATDVVMRRPVAVKLVAVDPAMEEETASRFLREARNTARIQHPNIVHVFDLGRSDRGELFFVMELLDGESLSQKLRKVSHFSAEICMYIAKQICRALEHAHSHGVIHRDLKPANIMLVPTADDPHFVKVLDFGVAKTQDQGTQLTRAGMLVGTIEYMAPEQIMGKSVDARADVYALGVIMYRMLTGTPLFREGGSAQLLSKHLNDAPEPLRGRAPSYEIPAALELVVLKCLAKLPDARFASMADLDDALDRLLHPSEDLIPNWAPSRSDARLHLSESVDSVKTELAPNPKFSAAAAITNAEGARAASLRDPMGLLRAGAPKSAAAMDMPATLVMPQPSALSNAHEKVVGRTAMLPGSQTSSLAEPKAIAQRGALAALAREHATPVSGSHKPTGQSLRRRHLPYTVTATLLILVALGFFGFSHMAAESIVGLGVALTLAAIILFFGLRPLRRGTR
jgi:serine/threonine protein kinase